MVKEKLKVLVKVRIPLETSSFTVSHRCKPSLKLCFFVAAISLVFERERSDAAILKLCKELKKGKEVGKSAWLESKLGSFQQTDFRIKRNDINAAREKETINRKKKKTTKILLSF